jgi:hypothetical protein
MSKLFLLWVFLAAIGPDLLLVQHPRWASRLAFLRMSITRRFALGRGLRAPTDRPAYRDDALPRSEASLPVITDPIEVVDGRLTPDGPRAWALVGGRSNKSKFVVRIDATVERGDVVLRARQAVPFVFFPFAAVAGLAWLYTKNPGREVGVIVFGFVIGAMWLGHFLLDTALRDVRTAQAMELIEHAIRAAERDAAEEDDAAEEQLADRE